MTSDELKTWRAAERERLIGERERLDPATLERFRRRIDAHLERSFPGLAAAKVAFCWPMRGEYDARPLADTLRARGAVTALPVVVAPGSRSSSANGIPAWRSPPGRSASPTRRSSEPVVPTVDAGAAERLGRSRLSPGLRRPASSTGPWRACRTAHRHRRRLRAGQDPDHPPQAWDVPMDWIVTERGVYRRDPGGLVFLGGRGPGQAGRPGLSGVLRGRDRSRAFGDPKA